MRVHDGPLTDAAFYFDLASPECYLAAERVGHLMSAPLEWQPVLTSRGAGNEDSQPRREALERSALSQGLQPLRWPTDHPVDSEKAMLAATYAKEIGRGVAFALAAFRQAFAGGHSLAEDDYVLIAAAACEIHPAALLRAIARRAVRERLAATTESARLAGVSRLPAFRFAGRVLCGERGLEEAAALVAPHTFGGDSRPTPAGETTLVPR